MGLDGLDSAVSDKNNIFIYKTVKFLNPNIRIITEIANISTMNFI